MYSVQEIVCAILLWKFTLINCNHQPKNMWDEEH